MLQRKSQAEEWALRRRAQNFEHLFKAEAPNEEKKNAPVRAIVFETEQLLGGQENERDGAGRDEREAAGPYGSKCECDTLRASLNFARFENAQLRKECKNLMNASTKQRTELFKSFTTNNNVAAQVAHKAECHLMALEMKLQTLTAKLQRKKDDFMLVMWSADDSRTQLQ